MTLRHPLLLCTLLAAGAWALPGQAQEGSQARAQAKVEVLGLRVVKPGPTKKLRPFNWTPGTSLSLHLEVPAGGLIDLDRKESKVEFFKDDKGTNLLAGKGFGRAGFGFFPRISEDRKHVLIEVQGHSVPAKGSQTLNLKGVAVFRAAKGTESFKHEALALKPGSKLEAGPVKWEVKSVGKSRWGKLKFQIEFKTEMEDKAIAGFRFFDAAGKEIKSSGASSSRFSGMGSVKITRSFRVEKLADTMTVEVKYWKDLRTVRVPVDLKVGAGL